MVEVIATIVEVFLAVSMLVFGILPFILIYKRYISTAKINEAALSQGIAIPVVSACLKQKSAVLSGVSPSVANNAVNPRLVLYEYDFEHRTILFKKRRQYSDIERIDVSSSIFSGFRNLVFIIRDNTFAHTFSMRDENARKALSILKKQGVQLTENVEEFLIQQN